MTAASGSAVSGRTFEAARERRVVDGELQLALVPPAGAEVDRPDVVAADPARVVGSTARRGVRPPSEHAHDQALRHVGAGVATRLQHLRAAPASADARLPALYVADNLWSTPAVADPRRTGTLELIGVTWHMGPNGSASLPDVQCVFQQVG